VRYEWDEAKNRRNQLKHDGVSFEMAATVFDDEDCFLAPDRVDHTTGEQRWHAIGMVQFEAELLLLVVHAYRENDHGEEIIRIISARRAGKHDIRRYQEPEVD